MEIKGKLIKVLPLETGEGRNGTWQKHDIIVEQAGQYPKNVCITLFGTKVSVDGIALGSEITVDVNIESREFNGKWYTNVNAWKVNAGSPAQAPATPDRGYEHEQTVTSIPSAQVEDDLPF